MQTIRTGVDLLEIHRIHSAIERHGERLLRRIFTPQELAENQGKTESLAVRFAAKEAVVKALGTGIGDVSWHDIEVLRGSAGEPVLHLHGKAQRLAKAQSLHIWSISLSHTRSLAIALVAAIGNS